MANPIDQYIAGLSGKKQQWVTELVMFMREIHPTLKETLDQGVPTFHGDTYYVAFAARSNYFSFYTNEEQIFPLIQNFFPSATIGKNNAQIKYSEKAVVEFLIDAINEVIDAQNARKSHKIIDMEAIKKWNSIPNNTQQLIISNVFCSTCGVTKIVNYTLHNDRFGFVLKGQCEKCSEPVARFVEN